MRIFRSGAEASSQFYNQKGKGAEQTFILLCTFFYSDAILYKERSRKSVTFVTYRDALYFLVLRRFEKVNL